MSTTLIGLIVFIATIALILNKKSLIPFAISVAPLQAASVINIKYFTIGISPYYFVLILISFQVLLSFLFRLKERKLKIQSYNSLVVNKYFLLLHLFFIWSTVSLSFPLIFEGMKVYVPRMGIEDELGVLSFSLSNIAQLAYLALNIVFIKQIYNFSIAHGTKIFSQTILMSGIFVMSIGLWDFSQIGFPRVFFSNNITSTLESTVNYRIIGRVASTFSEPSTLAAFLSPILIMFLTATIKLDKDFKYNVILSIWAFFLLFTTFSTTAYLSVFLGISLLFSTLVLKGLKKKSRLNLKIIPKESKKYNFFKIKILKMVILLAIISLLIFLVAANIDKSEILINILDDVVFKKNENLSAIYRSNSNTYGYKILFDTLGLGVGIGSNRPSSFPAYLASNFGILGIVFYLANIILLAIYLLKKIYLDDSPLVHHFFLLSSSNLIAMSLSIPDLNWPYFWIYTGFLLSSINHTKSNAHSNF